MKDCDNKRTWQAASCSSCSLLILLLCAVFHPARGFDVGPLIHEISPQSGVSSTSFVVSNPNDRALPLEFVPRKLLMNDSGAVAGSVAEEALMVFPPSALIAPGAVQRVRVQWNPDAPLIADQSYFVVVDQVGVSVPESQFEGVQVLLSFNVVVHVKALASEALLVANVERIEKHGSIDTAIVSVANEGTANAYGSRLSLRLSTGTRELRYSAADLQKQFDDLFFPPDHRRTLELQLPEGGWTEPFSVDVGYDEP